MSQKCTQTRAVASRKNLTKLISSPACIPDFTQKTGLNFDYSNFVQRYPDFPMKYNTNQRYLHIGGARGLWRSNRVWEQSRTGKTVQYRKGQFAYNAPAACNKQISTGPGIRLKSNPLPPFRNDAVKSRPVKRECGLEDSGKDLTDQRFLYLQENLQLSALRNFVYDDFLTDDQNTELVAQFRKKLGLEHEKTVLRREKRKQPWIEPFVLKHTFMQLPDMCFNDCMLSPFYATSFSIPTDTYLVTYGADFLDSYVPLSHLDQFIPYDRMPRRSTRFDIRVGDDLMYVQRPILRPFKNRLVAQGLSDSDDEMPFYSPVPESFNSAPLPIYDVNRPVSFFTSVRTMPSNINSAFSSFSNTAKSVQDVMPDIAKTVNSVRQSSEKLVEQASSMMERVENMLKPLADAFPSLLDVATLGGHMFNLFYDAANYSLYSLPVLMAKTAFSFSSMLRILMPHVYSSVTKTSLVAQGYHQQAGYFDNLFNNPRLVNCGKTMNAFAQIRNGFKSVEEFGGWVFAHLPTGLSELIAYYWPTAQTFNDRFKTYINTLMEAFGNMERNLEVTRNTAEFLRQEVIYFSPFLTVPTPSNRDVSNAFARSRVIASRVYVFAEQYSKHRTPRKSPFAAVFHGGTRAGKSVMLGRISRMLAEMERHRGRVSYTRQSGTEYWDGFTDDIYCTIFDDWLQNTSYDDVAEFFSLVTKQHYIVPMASLDNPLVGVKGTLNLSRVILAATNVENKQAVSTVINSPDALFARINIRFRVERVTWSTTQIYDTSEYLRHLRFQKYSGYTDDKGIDALEPTVYTFQQMMTVLVRAMRDHYQNQDAIDDTIIAEPTINNLREVFEGTEPTLGGGAIPGPVPGTNVVRLITQGKPYDEDLGQPIVDIFKQQNYNPLLRLAVDDVSASYLDRVWYVGSKSLREFYNKIPLFVMPQLGTIAISCAAVVAALSSLWWYMRPEPVCEPWIEHNLRMLKYLTTGEGSGVIKAEVDLEHGDYSELFKRVIFQLRAVPKSHSMYARIHSEMDNIEYLPMSVLYTESRSSDPMITKQMSAYRKTLRQPRTYNVEAAGDMIDVEVLKKLAPDHPALKVVAEARGDMIDIEVVRMLAPNHPMLKLVESRSGEAKSLNRRHVVTEAAGDMIDVEVLRKLVPDHPALKVVAEARGDMIDIEVVRKLAPTHPMLKLVESRSGEAKSLNRRHVVTEANITDHSKFTGSNFYGQQEKISSLYPGFVQQPRSDDVLQDLLVAHGSSDPQAQQQVDIAQMRVIPVSLMECDYEKHFAGVSSVRNYLNAIAIDARKVLLPKHFFYGRDGKLIKSTETRVYRINFRIKNVNHPVDFDISRVTFLRNSANKETIDGAIFDLSGTTVPSLQSMYKFFISDQYLSLLRDGDHATMVGFTLSNGQPIPFQRSFQIEILRKALVYEASPLSQFSITSGVTYNTVSQLGDCGSPVVVNHPNIPNKLIGYHVFGSERDTFGGATLITKEMLDRVLFVPQTPVVPHNVSFSVTDRTKEMIYQARNLSLELFGEVDIPVHVSRKTVLTPTPLYSHLQETVNVPSVKSESEGCDPLFVGTFLYGSDLVNIDSRFDVPVLEYFRTHFKDQPAQIFDARAAVNKQGGMDALNLKTSAGYPYVTRGQNKATFLAVDPANGYVDYKDPIFAQDIQKYIDSWKDQITEVVWISTLKDELLKVGKLCRVFTYAPFEYTIACRAYFGSWIDMMHSTVGSNFSCIGMNPESFQWSQMGYKLLEIGEFGIDADAPNWDKNLLTKFLHLSCRAVNRWYKKNDPNWKPEHSRARFNLITQLCHSYIIVNWLLLRKHKGMPSGHVLTALFNTMCNMIMHLIWFLESVPVEFKDLFFYDKLVCTRIYGDDSLDAIAYHMLKFLNRVTMIAVYQRYCAMTITSSMKDGTITPYDSVMSLTFLKRGFRADGLHFKPTLAKRSMFGMLGHVRQSKHASLQEQLEVNLRVFSAFAYFYGPDFYSKSMAYLGSFFPLIQFPQYAYYDSLYLHGKIDVLSLLQ